MGQNNRLPTIPYSNRTFAHEGSLEFIRQQFSIRRDRTWADAEQEVVRSGHLILTNQDGWRHVTGMSTAIVISELRCSFLIEAHVPKLWRRQAKCGDQRKRDDRPVRSTTDQNCRNKRQDDDPRARKGKHQRNNIDKKTPSYVIEYQFDDDGHTDKLRERRGFDHEEPIASVKRRAIRQMRVRVEAR